MPLAQMVKGSRYAEVQLLHFPLNCLQRVSNHLGHNLFQYCQTVQELLLE